METEIKLALHPEDADAVPGIPLPDGWQAGPARTTHLRNTYFDTPDRAVLRSGAALRLRYDGTRWLQAIKTGGSGTLGLHERGEYEMPCAGDALAWDALAAACPCGFVQDAELRAAVGPVFRTDFTRTCIDLEGPDGARVELACDRGVAATEHDDIPLCEVELEQRAGDVAALHALARHLAEHVRLWPEDRSKAERGYALADRRVDAPVHAGAPAETAGMRTREACAALVADGLLQLQRNLPAMLAADDPEGVHQARVGARRLRGALALFAPYVPRKHSRALRADLKWLCAPLGAARDWDVLRLRLQREMAGAAADPLAAALLELVCSRRDAAYALLHERLRAHRCGAVLLDAAAWVRACDADLPLRKRASRPIEATAPGLLDDAYEAVRAGGRHFRRRSTEELHALRLLVKKLRYAVDFFGPLFPSKRQRRFARRVRRLQERLGAFNDCFVAEALVAQLPDRAGVRVAADRMLRAETGGPEACRRRARKAWCSFRTAKPFWR